MKKKEEKKMNNIVDADTLSRYLIHKYNQIVPKIFLELMNNTVEFKGNKKLSDDQINIIDELRIKVSKDFANHIDKIKKLEMEEKSKFKKTLMIYDNLKRRDDLNDVEKLIEFKKYIDDILNNKKEKE